MRREQDTPMSARVPADVEKPDKIVFGLTARQAAILGATGLLLWGLYQATHTVVSPVVFTAVAIPIAGVAFAVVTLRRDGLALDAWLLAAWRQRRAPRRLVPADNVRGDTVPDAPAWVGIQAGPLPAPLRLPAEAISTEGAIDLGAQGTAHAAACSTVNFGLRTAGEQNSLIGGFSRWLHSLSGPVQIVVRAQRLDLEPYLDVLADEAGGLPHPALEQACLGHVDFLRELSRSRGLLRRHVTVVLRQPATGRHGRDTSAAQTVARRAQEAARALRGCEVVVAPLDGAQAHAVLGAAADPNGGPQATRAGTASGVVTARPDLRHLTPGDTAAEAAEDVEV
ncbi:PrgI family protein [Saccharomonospora piscinae]|uniref:PrgI family protein n=1 Tax=Saccharomonospora piscinae TaxID=687388 RepID=UPI0004BBF0AD|nr:PrgI family protein [Saccharomonospora piscinae]